MTEAASTTQTGQQSSNQQGQSTSSDQGSGGASNPTPTRPDYVPETFWDAATNSVKAQEFTTHIGELAALKAQHEARLAAKPKDAGGYELKFPETFKPDTPIEFKPDDPRVAELRAFAHEQNWDQATFSRALEIEAKKVSADNKAYNDAVAEETRKLGANATARVTALRTWLAGHLGAAGADDLLGTDKKAGLLVYSAAGIEHLEKLQLALSNQGGSRPNGNGREQSQPTPLSREQILYPNMQRKAS